MSRHKSIKVGVVGVGHLGKFHVEQYLNITKSDFVGVFDIDEKKCQDVGERFNVKCFPDLDSLLDVCDAVSIVTPTTSHCAVSLRALEHNCHLFIEKPIAQTIKDAQTILRNAEIKNKKIQVGHIEQFNPAFLSLNFKNVNPMFIESHRLSSFNPRGLDVPVVLDLMIHDIGIVLKMVNSDVSSVEASGVSVITDTVDIANARLTFNNGCVANLTSSRVSQKSLRKLRFFQKNNYTTIDFLNNEIEKYRVSNSNPNINENDLCIPIDSNPKKFVSYTKPTIKPYNTLRKELNSFIESIVFDKKPLVDGKDATKALELAIKIQNIIDKK